MLWVKCFSVWFGVPCLEWTINLSIMDAFCFIFLFTTWCSSLILVYKSFLHGEAFSFQRLSPLISSLQLYHQHGLFPMGIEVDLPRLFLLGIDLELVELFSLRIEDIHGLIDNISFSHNLSSSTLTPHKIISISWLIAPFVLNCITLLHFQL